LAVLCGSVDEVVFWLLLGSVLILSQRSEILGNYALGGAILYAVFMILMAPRLITYICSKISSTRNMLGFMLIGCFLSSVLADIVNLHEIFGAFLFGLLLPANNQYLQKAREQISEFITLMLLPIYFVKSGMLTSFHIIFNEKIIILGIIVTLIAIIGKFSGAFLTGRILGYSKSESMLLGSLLNMRGIIEVVILNIGLELNIISQSIYSILIIMTLISNFFATALSLHINKKMLKQSGF
jgi:Kef-type K+ transport system membrane component KefB